MTHPSVIASPFKSAYVAAKHGLIGFSKVMALETADADITVNTICPSYVKTPLVDAQIANQAKVCTCFVDTTMPSSYGFLALLGTRCSLTPIHD